MPGSWLGTNWSNGANIRKTDGGETENHGKRGLQTLQEIQLSPSSLCGQSQKDKICIQGEKPPIFPSHIRRVSEEGVGQAALHCPD